MPGRRNPYPDPRTLDRPVGVLFVVVEVEARPAARPPGCAAWMPAARSPPTSPGRVTIAELLGSIPIAARKRFASADVVLVDRLDADRLQQLERRQRADPREPGGGGVEPAGVVGQPQRRPDVRLVGRRRPRTSRACAGTIASSRSGATVIHAVPRGEISHL